MTHSQLTAARRPIGALAAAVLTAGGLVAVAVPAAAVLGTARTASTPSVAVAPTAGQGPVAGDCGTSTPCDLHAVETTATLRTSDTTSITPKVWVFHQPVTGETSVAPRSAVIRGTVGTPVSITLTNDLPDTPVSQTLKLSVPQAETFTDSATVGRGSSHTYSFTPTRPGTYVYQAGIPSDLTGSDSTRQVAMGLVGAIVVAPAGGAYCTANSAYCTAESTFDDEAVLIYTDLDTALAADPAGFNMRDYKPQYHLINGAAEKDIVGVQTDYGHRVMLRLLNGSILEKSPTLLGLTMTQFGRATRPAAPVLDSPGQIINTGEAIDATVTVPAAPALPTDPVTNPTRYALFDSPIHLNNASWLTTGSKNSPTLAGAITYLTVGGTGVNPSGPDVKNLVVGGQPGSQSSRPLTITATLDTTGRGGQNVMAGEFFLDAVGKTGTGLALTPVFPATFNTNPVPVTATLSATDAALLADGSHTLFVRGLDLAGAWGPARSVAFKIDNHGPVISAVSPATAYVNGTKALAFSGTVSDATTGGSYVRTTQGVTASFDGGTPTTVTTNSTVAAPRVTGAFSASLPASTFVAPLLEGSHTLTLTGYDQWGQPSATPYQLPVVVDRTAPVTARIILRPSATNGTTGNPAKPGTIGILADIADASPVTVVEAYLKQVDPTGSISGIQMTSIGASPVGDGSTRYTADMPLSWLGGYTTSQSVNVFVVGLDAAGNRGPGASTPLLIDKQAPTAAPTVTAVQGTGVPGDATVALTAVGADLGTPLPSGISGGEWWVGTDPGVGLANPMYQVTPGATLASPYTVTGTMDLNALGLVTAQNVTVRVRLKDGAGNWGPAGSRTFAITAVRTIFADSFESTVFPLPWTSQTTSSGGTASFSTSNALAGLRSLLATTGAGATAFVTKDISAYPSHARVVAKVTFAPDSTSTGSSSSHYVTVLTGVPNTGSNTSYVEVRYQRIGAVVRFTLCTRTGNNAGTLGCATSPSTGTGSVATAAGYALVLTYAANNGVTLTVNGTSISRTTSVGNRTIGAIRLGVVAQSGSTGLTARFDTFLSGRSAF